MKKNKPWDWFFAKREPLWVIIEMVNGKKIGGIYSTNSYTSSYPAEEQIYLEKTWKLDENGNFLPDGAVDRSKGIMISSSQIAYMEFFSSECQEGPISSPPIPPICSTDFQDRLDIENEPIPRNKPIGQQGNKSRPVPVPNDSSSF